LWNNDDELKMSVRMALLTDLALEIRENSTRSEAIYTYDLARTLSESALSFGGLTLDVFAVKPAKASPFSIVPVCEKNITTGVLDQESTYGALLQNGAFDGYDIIHSLIPLSTAILEKITSKDVKVVSTPLNFHTELKFANDRFLIKIGKYSWSHNVVNIPPSVDTTKFRPAANTTNDFYLFLGDQSSHFKISETIEYRTGIPVKYFSESNVEELFQNALAVLFCIKTAQPSDIVWIIRAVACGTPVAILQNDEFINLVYVPPFCTIFADNDLNTISNLISQLNVNDGTRETLRKFTLGYYNSRSYAARLLEAYSMMLEG
jgi:hypothetical protein